MALAALAAFLLVTGTMAVGAGWAGSAKRWRHNTSWSNGDNWSLGAPPLPNQHAAFTDAFGGLTVALPAGETHVWTLLLPRDGILLLPRDGALEVEGSDDSFYDAVFVEENQFTRTEPLGWLDPDNWLPENAKDVADLVAVPHAERIPCRFEVAVLPADASFAIELPQVPVVVAGVRFGSEVWSEGRWRTALASRGGSAMFRGEGYETAVAVAMAERSGGGAEDVCSPARDPREAEALQEAVCRYARPRCAAGPAPPCLAPIRPRGHCCDICGGVVLAEASQRTRAAAVRRAVARRLRAEGLAQRVAVHVGMLPASTPRGPRRLQVVTAERGAYAGDAAAAAHALLAELDRNAALGLGAASVEVAGPPARSSTWAFVAGSVFGTLLGVLVVFGAIFVTFHGWREVMSFGAVQGGAFVFARFENVDTENETVEVVANVSGGGQSFDNPMYDQTASSETGGAPCLQYSQLQEQEQELPAPDTTQAESVIETQLVDIDIKPTES